MEGTRAPLVAQGGGGHGPGKKKQVVCENPLTRWDRQGSWGWASLFSPGASLHIPLLLCTPEDGLVLSFSGFRLIRELDREQVPTRQ